MSYRAIGFDYGGVITGESSTTISRSIAALIGVSEDEYKRAYYHYNVALNQGRITWIELWSSVLNELGVSGKLPQLLAYLRQMDFGTPDKRLLQLITKLRQVGLKVGMLSNNTKEVAAKMRKEGLDSYFDVFDLSAETGLVKPQAEAFYRFIDQLAVAPEELIFVDDSKNSLSTAESVGYHPILYTTYDELIKQLTLLGVSV